MSRPRVSQLRISPRPLRRMPRRPERSRIRRGVIHRRTRHSSPQPAHRKVRNRGIRRRTVRGRKVQERRAPPPGLHSARRVSRLPGFVRPLDQSFRPPPRCLRRSVSRYRHRAERRKSRPHRSSRRLRTRLKSRKWRWTRRACSGNSPPSSRPPWQTAARRRDIQAGRPTVASRRREGRKGTDRRVVLRRDMGRHRVDRRGTGRREGRNKALVRRPVGRKAMGCRVGLDRALVGCLRAVPRRQLQAGNRRCR